MNGAHEDAHSRHPEVGAEELEPLRPREPRLDSARPDAREGYAHQTLVPPPRQHEERISRNSQVLETLVEGFQRLQVLSDCPDGVVTRKAHAFPILPTFPRIEPSSWYAASPGPQIHSKKS